MKLQRDKHLVKHLQDKNLIVSETVAKGLLHEIDAYLEEHGFHIYPVKKEKRPSYIPPDWFPNKKLSVDDYVVVTDKEHSCFNMTGRIAETDNKYSMVHFLGLMNHARIPNEHLELKEPKEKGTVTFKEVGEDKFKEANDHFRKLIRDAAIDVINAGWKPTEETPSADGEESQAMNFALSRETWKVTRETQSLLPPELKSQGWMLDDFITAHPTFWTPFQRCPVCDGNGTKFDTRPFSIPANTVSCHCCSGSGVIPMQRVTK